MATMDTDRDWQFFAATDPYWAVLTDERFRRGRLDEQGLENFFQTGETHVATVFKLIDRHLAPGFAPRSCLDFGCGVGRLVIPFARRCASVVGVDVADGMLQEARRRCDELGLNHVQLVKGDDELSAVEGPFDLIHSHIVFQHIPRDRGMRLLEALLNRLADGGVGVLHFTHATTGLRRAHHGPLRLVLGMAARSARRLLGRRESVDRPVMQMNSYDLNTLMLRLQHAGVSRLWVEFTDHGGERGVVLFFRKGGGEGVLF